MFRIGEKVWCVEDGNNYIVTGYHVSKKTVSLICAEEETLYGFKEKEIDEAFLRKGWKDYICEFKKESAPSLMELFQFVEKSNGADIETIYIYNTNKKGITSEPWYFFNSWESLKEHPVYMNGNISTRIIERYSLCDNFLSVYLDLK